MHQEQNECKTRSRTVPIEDLNSSKTLSFSSKTGKILQVQSQIRKLKNLLSMEKQLQHNHSQYQKINDKIHQFEKELKVKRKQVIAQKLQLIENRKQERVHNNKQANQMLLKIKEEQRKRRQKMESIVNMYKQEYDLVYEKNLKKRKQQMKFDFNQIKIHQSHYLKLSTRRPSFRVKTQNSHNRSEQSSKYFSPGGRQYIARKEDEKTIRLRELIKKGKEYGELAERKATNVKITREMVRKGKNYKKKGGFDESIDKYEQQKKIMQKPRLDTNLSGDKQALQEREIQKIAHQSSPMKEKLTILQNLANGYKVKYENGQSEALEKMCNINLRRAQLFLHDI